MEPASLGSYNVTGHSGGWLLQDEMYYVRGDAWVHGRAIKVTLQYFSEKTDSSNATPTAVTYRARHVSASRRRKQIQQGPVRFLCSCL